MGDGAMLSRAPGVMGDGVPGWSGDGVRQSPDGGGIGMVPSASAMA